MSPALRDELRQTRPFQSLEQEAYLNLLRTSAVLTDAFEQVLKPVGITPQQFNVLRILRGAEPDGLCRNELRDRMLTRMPDVTRLLDRMEEAGLIARARDTVDRRLVTTRITPEGLRLLDRMEEAGLVTRERGDRDRRLVRTHVTARGLEILAALDDQVTAEHARSLGHLTEEQLRTLVALLTLARGSR